MKKRSIFLFCSVCLALALAAAAAAEPSGREIVKRLDEMGSVEDMTADLEMRIINRNGLERARRLTMTSERGTDGARKALIRFLAPADVKGTGFLSISRPQGEDESWLYLPALGKPRRIAAEEKSSSFMGSDFSYADIGMLKIDDYRHTLLRTERLEGEEVYVGESVPVSDAIRRADGFARKVWWIRKESYTIAKAEFLDTSGKVIKSFSGAEVVKLAEDAWFATRLEMRNLATGSRTVLTFKNIRINTGVPDDYFTVRQLTRS